MLRFVILSVFFFLVPMIASLFRLSPVDDSCFFLLLPLYGVARGGAVRFGRSCCCRSTS